MRPKTSTWPAGKQANSRVRFGYGFPLMAPGEPRMSFLTSTSLAEDDVMREHPEPIGPSPVSRPIVLPARAVPTVLFVVPETERALYLGDAFTRVYVHTDNDAARFIAIERPRLVVIDMDEPSIGGMDICATAHALRNTSVLVTTGKVENVPAMLKAGCHGVLLKPFTPNLLAARLGRVIKETERPWGVKALPPGWLRGTNRIWADTACPKCGVRGATSFDFSSYRRMWLACLSCDNTWLGPRRE